MKTALKKIILVKILIVAASAFCQEEKSLDEVFALAVERSEALAGKTELVIQAEAQASQAFSNFLPTLNFNSLYLRQQTPGSSLAQNIFPAEQTTLRLSATHNLFRGLKDLALLKEKKMKENAAKAAKEQALIQLYEDTARSYFAVLTYEKELENISSEIEAHRKRRNDLSQQRRALLAREADVVAVDSALAALQSAAANTRGLLAAEREALAFIANVEREIVLANPTHMPQKVAALEAWLERLESRPDLKQSKYELHAAEEAFAGSWRGHLPSVDLAGNYYFKRPGVNSDVTWDAQILLTVPIFEGARTQAQVREAASRRKEKEIGFTRAHRQAEQSIRSAHATVSHGLIQVEQLSQASELSRRNYELILRDNRSGIARNLDVLQALASAFETKRAFDRARFVVLKDYLRLEVISGERTLAAGKGKQ